MISQISDLPLADIHLQSAPSYVPLSMWGNLLLLMLLLITALAGFLLYRRYQKNRIRRTAIVTLSQITEKDGLGRVNALLKQVALGYNERCEVASLSGDVWFGYLDACLAERYQGFSAQQKLWLDALYTGRALSSADFKRCKSQARIWIRHARFDQQQSRGAHR